MQQYPASTGSLQTPSTPPDDRESTLSLTVPAEVFDSWNEAAMRDGKLLREWAVDALIEAAEDEEES